MAAAVVISRRQPPPRGGGSGSFGFLVEQPPPHPNLEATLHPPELTKNYSNHSRWQPDWSRWFWLERVAGEGEIAKNGGGDFPEAWRYR